MKPRMLARALAAPLALALAAAAAAAAPQGSPAPAAADAITGEWAGTFEFTGGNPFMRTLELELEGTRVSGRALSPLRREDGTITGSWQAGELSLVIESERGTMTLTGALKEGKLSGDWDVGHASGTWSAKKKPAASGAPR